MSPHWPLLEWTQPPCWARRGKGHRRVGWTQKGHLHCQPQKVAVPPSFHTWVLPKPTSPLMGRNPAPEESVDIITGEITTINKYFSHRFIIKFHNLSKWVLHVDEWAVGACLCVWGHLGRDVIWRPTEGGGGDTVEDTFLAHPKVCQLTVTVSIQKNVVQLQVSAEQEENVRVCGSTSNGKLD